MTTTAIVTGGSRGLGLAVAEDLARDGWHVVIDGRNADALREAAARIGARAVRATSPSRPTATSSSKQPAPPGDSTW